MSVLMAPEVNSLIEAPKKTLSERQEEAFQIELERVDRLFPYWYEHINIYALDLTNCFDCILGQATTNNYTDAFISVTEDGYTYDEELGSPYYKNDVYRQRWIDAINERRNA